MLPWFQPGVAISVVVGLASCGIVGRALGVGRVIAFTLLLSLGIIVAATLTPRATALDFGAQGPAYCDFSRIWLPSWEEVMTFYDTGGNILMFIPLGAAIGLLPRSRRKVAIVAGAIALPFAIETIQLVVPWLDRACESADVVDNLTGLLLGLVAGTLAGRMVRVLGRRPG
jgi:hypothetical protein